MARREAGHRSAAISKLLPHTQPRSPRHDREARSRLAMTFFEVFQQAPSRRMTKEKPEYDKKKEGNNIMIAVNDSKQATYELNIDNLALQSVIRQV
jgi:hypothetical protein